MKQDSIFSPFLEIAEWPDDYLNLREQDNEEDRDECKHHANNMCPAQHSPFILLENFSDDIVSLIAANLTLQELLYLSVCSKRMLASCRSDTVWTELYHQRWNTKTTTSCSTRRRTFQNYVRAHSHPHDLWITHWNCVYPTDHVTPGRCCVQAEQQKMTNSNNNNDTEAAAAAATSKPNGCARSSCCCPDCRQKNEWSNYRPASTATTEIELLAQETDEYRNKLAEKYGDDPYMDNAHGSRNRKRSCLAFQQASTFDRQLSTIQFEHEENDFLTDLLFFNLTSMGSDGDWECEQLLQECTEQYRLDTDKSSSLFQEQQQLHETAHHSSHIIKLHNSHFCLPILFSVGVQRSDCFTVYPSEGYIAPGECTYVTVGIRPLASAMAYAFDGLNVARKGLRAGWSQLHSEHGHLPLAPILIQYFFSSTQPVKLARYDTQNVDTFASRVRATLLTADTVQGTGVENWSKERKRIKSMLDFHNKKYVPAHQTRSICLSAHINSHFYFTDFLAATCRPWNSSMDDLHGPVYFSPILREEYPTEYARLQNTDDMVWAKSKDTKFNIENTRCVHCGNHWGRRDEELAQAHMVAKLEWAGDRKRRRILLQNVVLCARLLDEGLTGCPEHLSSMLYVMTNIVQFSRGSPCSNPTQKARLMELKEHLDSAFAQIPDEGGEWKEGRRARVCRKRLFTSPGCRETCQTAIDDTVPLVEWNNESLSALLQELPRASKESGRWYHGSQRDPKHPRIHARIKCSVVSDVFLNSPISSLKAGVAMIRDPSSLVPHGIYEVCPHPGVITRRPKTTTAQTSCVSLNATTLHSCQVYRWLQDGLAHGSHEHSQATTTQSYSLYTYLNGVPPPGVGTFALSHTVAQSDLDPVDGSDQIEALVIDGVESAKSSERDGSKHGDVEAAINDNQRATGNAADNARPPRTLQPRRGLRERLRLLWTENFTPAPSSVFVDRTILIASQHLSIFFALAPVFHSLLARSFCWIPAEPLQYLLRNYPFEESTGVRYLTSEECGGVASIVFLTWLYLMRWTERHTSRTLFRIMQDHDAPTACSFSKRLLSRYERLWDAFCPQVFQRRVFVARWNARNREDVNHQINLLRSRHLNAQQSITHISSLHLAESVVFGDSRDKDIDASEASLKRKLMLGSSAAAGNFCSCSPHFCLNVLSVFSCSISLGMNISLNSFERGWYQSDRGTRSIVGRSTVLTAFILGSLLGQLVGSSGGMMFIADFIATSTSFFLGLGGAFTITASGIESWICFFALSSTALWGHIFGRVAILVGVRQRKRSLASRLLSYAITCLFLFWILIIFFSEWETPADAIITIPATDSYSKSDRRELLAQLQ